MLLSVLLPLSAIWNRRLSPFQSSKAGLSSTAINSTAWQIPAYHPVGPCLFLLAYTSTALCGKCHFFLFFSVWTLPGVWSLGSVCGRSNHCFGAKQLPQFPLIPVDSVPDCGTAYSSTGFFDDQTHSLRCLSRLHDFHFHS